jgi:hypothetical protein
MMRTTRKTTVVTLSSDWLTDSNPFVAEMYPDDDPNRYIDCLFQIYAAIAERLNTDGGLPQVLADALWMTAPAFTTSSASYQGALLVTNNQPVAAMAQLRESLEGIITIGMDWATIPTDSPAPRPEDVFADLTTTYIEWQKSHDAPLIPPPELWTIVVMPVLFFNRRAWPPSEVEDWPTFDPYSMVDDTNMPPVHKMAAVIRFPLAVGAILRWRERWIGGWGAGSERLELSDAEQVVALEVENELLPTIGRIMERVGLKWPDWARSLLPFHSKEEGDRAVN